MIFKNVSLSIKVPLIVAMLVATNSNLAFADWTLATSKVTYHVVHPLHKVDGTTTEAKGKAVCSKTTCDFLVAVPVKTFSSDNSNRDEHVWEVVRAANHPMVAMRFSIPVNKLDTTNSITTEVELNGVKVKTETPVTIKSVGTDKEASGRLNLKMTDFKIEPPSLLAISTKDEFEIDFESRWKNQ